MHPRLPDDPLRSPSRRVRSPRRGPSKVDVMLGPEQPRHSVTKLFMTSQTSIDGRIERNVSDIWFVTQA